MRDRRPGGGDARPELGTNGNFLASLGTGSPGDQLSVATDGFQASDLTVVASCGLAMGILGDLATGFAVERRRPSQNVEANQLGSWLRRQHKG
jgi:hypothetical protein